MDGIFAKRKPADAIDHLQFDAPSKRTLTTSIFPSPQTIPREYTVDNLEALIPKFWNLERLPNGELLLTREQAAQLTEMFKKKRREELEECYKDRLLKFVCKHERAVDAAKYHLPVESARVALSPYA
jgi:hypothetical protein